MSTCAFKRIIITASLVSLFGSGCSIRHNYRIEKETRGQVDKIQQAKSVHVRPLRVSYEPPEEWGLTEEKWNEHISKWAGDFEFWLNTWTINRKVEQQLIWAAQDDAPETGPIIVLDITSTAKGRAANSVADLTCTDAESGEILYEATLYSKGIGGIFHNSVKYNIGDFCLAIAELLKRGTVQPPQRGA